MKMNYQYSKSWYGTFMPTHLDEITQNEIKFIKKYLPLSSYQKILDVCCGTGRHSINLAQLGYDVTGIDINNSALQKGKELVNEEMKINFLLFDMREISSIKSNFDGVLNLWQSFGFFDSKTNESILEQISDILVSSGRFILDIFNYDFFVNHQGKYEFVRKNINITETKTILDNRLYINLEYHELHKNDNYDFQIFKPDEIITLIEKYNFKLLIKCSNFDTKISPNESNPRMQFVFEKES
ncbi:MAG: class I SAM-dependent methyltransferase [Asgard group archaeon]|nr:class I SAM-dependent methyltransferase [Asgard group archaeon]